MKNLLSILISVIVFYIFFIVFVKSTHFNEEQVYFEYKQEGLSQLADSLVAKKIIYEKTSFLLLAKALKVQDKIKEYLRLFLQKKLLAKFSDINE